MNKVKFNELLEKYKSGRLTPGEYQLLLDYLQESSMEKELDNLLIQYWKDIILGEVYANSKNQNTKKYSRINIHWRWSIAAFFILVFGYFFYLYGGMELFGGSEVTYATGYGERLEVELNDGSSITLNANSELRWRDQWRSLGRREAILKGEAFFEVKKHTSVPFMVYTEDVVVEVIGTSFNVDSRKEKTVVYLEEGKVNLKLKNEEGQDGEEKDQEVIMKPGDQINYSVKDKIIEKMEGRDLMTAASWKKNVLNFKNKHFSEVLEILRDIYGKSFECTDRSLLLRPMVIGVPYADWEAVKHALELSLNIEFQKISNVRYKVKKSNR